MSKLSTNHHDKKMLLINYETAPLRDSDKVRFYYALKGRDGKSGVLSSYSGDYLGKQVIMVPFSHKSDIEMFFKSWKIKHSIKEITLHNELEVAYNE